MNINSEMEEYSRFLNSTFDSISQLSIKITEKYGDEIVGENIMNGYFQFIWELMLEKQLCSGVDSIEAYGDGADFYGKSSRVLYPEKNANHRVVVKNESAFDFFSMENIQIKTFDFIKLVSFDGFYFCVKPPFDYVLCDDDDGNKYLFKLNEIDIELEKY